MRAFKRVSIGIVTAQIFVQLFCSGITQAQEGSNQCGNYPKVYDLTGVCGNRQLPSDKVRNLRGLRLECGSGVDHYVRTFIPFNYKMWKYYESESREEMQAFRLKEAPIQWSGSIPYETTEVWQWTDCVYGADPVCGYHKECHTERQCSTNSEGKETCQDVEVCVDVMNNCYHDEDQSEARYCSTERFDFEASFSKPGKDWKPGAKGYYDVIPNKYDLLPGEVEDVQVFANSGRSTSVRPSVEIGDAWNKYNPDIVIHQTGSGSASCRYNQPLSAKVTIHTQERIYGKTTPNAMRIPVDARGQEKNPLQWLEASKVKANGEATKAKPRNIQLMDVSHTMISAMARQSRKFDTIREEAKVAAGKGGTQSADEYTKNKGKAEESGFWKSTNVRVRLKEFTGWASRDIRPTHNLYMDGNSADENGIYDLGLIGGSCETDLYRASGPFNDDWYCGTAVDLKKKKKYKMLVSMYQEGVPFYKQGSSNKSDGAYSKELQINFITEDLDERGLKQRFLNWQGGW